jgi:hypothetical protein
MFILIPNGEVHPTGSPFPFSPLVLLVDNNVLVLPVRNSAEEKLIK